MAPRGIPEDLPPMLLMESQQQALLPRVVSAGDDHLLYLDSIQQLTLSFIVIQL
jgi:hypothetical protein